jgi:hypothetical protein
MFHNPASSIDLVSEDDGTQWGLSACPCPRQAHSNVREVEINKSNDSTFSPIQLRHVINFFAMCPQK